LGNVLVTVSDRKWAIDTPTAPTIAYYYQPNIINAQDYYPFGMAEPGRRYTIIGDSDYTFGYQGSMKDNDIYGKGNAYTTTNREDDEWYDRWWSPDHVVKPGESPYVSMGDNPIVGKDDDGNVVIFINGMYTDNSGGTAAYWGSYSQDIMTQLKDYSARYVDGSLGGSKNTTDAAKKGFWSGIWGVIVSVLTESNVNMQVRINAGEAQGLKDAASIIANLKPGETIKIITHSMGTAFARGYVKGILEYTEAQHGNLKNNKGQTVTVKIDIEIDVNAFQSKDIPKPDKSNIGYAYSKTGESGVQEIPGFGTTPQGTTDISTDKDKASGHSIETNDQHPTEGNITSDLSNPINTYKADANKGGNPANIEEGNNNADAPK